jgi:hypothetical protein
MSVIELSLIQPILTTDEQDNCRPAFIVIYVICYNHSKDRGYTHKRQ